jgi:hypothetical protein
VKGRTCSAAVVAGILVVVIAGPVGAQPSECREQAPDPLELASYRFEVVDGDGRPAPRLYAWAGVAIAQTKWIWSHFDYGWVTEWRSAPVAIDYDAASRQYTSHRVAKLRPRFVLDLLPPQRCWERFDRFWVVFRGRDERPSLPWQIEKLPLDAYGYQIPVPNSVAERRMLPDPSTPIRVVLRRP